MVAPAAQAASQTAMPARTPAGLAKALYCNAAAGRFTFVSPISFCFGAVEVELIVDSAKATVFDVPSVTMAIAFDCCQAKSPVVGTVERLGTFVLVMVPMMLVVVPSDPK